MMWNYSYGNSKIITQILGYKPFQIKNINEEIKANEFIGHIIISLRP